jgi:integrase
MEQMSESKMGRPKMYDMDFYNEYQKQRYLKSVTENEFPFHERLLRRASISENVYNKDLYDFNLPEIERFLKYLKPTKLSTSRNNAYIVNNYITWANAQKLRQTNINPLSGIMDDEFFNKFVDEAKKTLFTEDEIDYIISKTVNFQDKVILRLIFEGVTGDGVEELLNLREKNIDYENNRLLLTDKDKSTRIITVSDKCMALIRGALNETEYLSKNGDTNDSKAKSVKLVKSDYVLKTGMVGKNRDGEVKADRYLVFRRLTTLREFFDEPYLNVTNIRDSGMLKMAADLYYERGKLDKEEYEVIWKQFNLGKIVLNGEQTINYFPYKKQFLNVETIEKLYGENEEEGR